MIDSLYSSFLRFITNISQPLIFCVLLALFLFNFILIYKFIKSNHRAQEKEDIYHKSLSALQMSEHHMQILLKTQNEMQGRIQAMAEIFGKRQAQVNQTIQEQLSGFSHHIGRSLHTQTQITHENLTKLQERLALIDHAQNNIQSLAGQVVELQSILADKQTRGAFGQSQMETIIADALPKKSYSFQATLSNNKRPDCLIYLPNSAPPLVIDAKFPLEAWSRMQAARSEEVLRPAAQQFKKDMEAHISDIATKYLIAGETFDTAFLFVPSESIFATLYEKFDGIIQKAYKHHVRIVSPSLLMLAVSVIQSIVKDSYMREKAHLIQSEVMHLFKDVTTVQENVERLKKYFERTEKTMDDILASTKKIEKRVHNIAEVELEGQPSEPVLKENVAPHSMDAYNTLFQK